MDISSGNTRSILNLWQRLSGLPGGKRLFSWLLGRGVPYSGTIGSRIQHLEPGFAVVTLVEHRRVRNHYNSIHAVALTNLGELVSGLAMTLALPGDARGIPIGLAMDFRKKARGTITARSRCDPPESNEERQYEVHASLEDESGDEVAHFTATWAVSPKA